MPSRKIILFRDMRDEMGFAVKKTGRNVATLVILQGQGVSEHMNKRRGGVSAST
jgi:hypothetical protein